MDVAGCGDTRMLRSITRSHLDGFHHIPIGGLKTEVKIPKEIKPAWVKKHGEAVGEVHRGEDGYKACLLKKRGPKLVHFTQLYPKRNFTLTHREAEQNFKPYVRYKGKWRISD